jgi:hypothetical protein
MWEKVCHWKKGGSFIDLFLDGRFRRGFNKKLSSHGLGGEEEEGGFV